MTANQDHKGKEEKEDNQVCQENKARQVLKGNVVKLDLLDLKAHLESVDNLVLEEIQDHKDKQVQGENQGHVVNLDYQEVMVNQVNQDSEGREDLSDRLDHKEDQDHKDNRDQEVRMGNPVEENQDHLVSVVLREHQEHLEMQANKAQQVQLASQDHKVNVENVDHQEYRENKV